jgi:hypothetical protein
MDKLNIILETFENLNDKGAIDEGLYLSSCNALKDIASSITHQKPEPSMTAAEVAAVLGSPRSNATEIAEQNAIRLSYSEEFKDILSDEYRLMNSERFRGDETISTDTKNLKESWRTIKQWIREDNITTRRALWKIMRGWRNNSGYIVCEAFHTANRIQERIESSVPINRTDYPIFHSSISKKMRESIFGRTMLLHSKSYRWFGIKRLYNSWRRTKPLEHMYDLKRIGMYEEQKEPSMRKVNLSMLYFKTYDSDPNDRTLANMSWSMWTDRIQLGRMMITERLTFRAIMEYLDGFCKRMDEKPLRPYTYTHPDLETFLIHLKTIESHHRTTMNLVTSGVAGKTIGQKRYYESIYRVHSPRGVDTTFPFVSAEFDEVWDDKKTKK